jgi:hypothetical protein
MRRIRVSALLSAMTLLLGGLVFQASSGGSWNDSTSAVAESGTALTLAGRDSLLPGPSTDQVINSLGALQTVHNSNINDQRDQADRTIDVGLAGIFGGSRNDSTSAVAESGTALTLAGRDSLLPGLSVDEAITFGDFRNDPTGAVAKSGIALSLAGLDSLLPGPSVNQGIASLGDALLPRGDGFGVNPALADIAQSPAFGKNAEEWPRSNSLHDRQTANFGITSTGDEARNWRPRIMQIE